MADSLAELHGRHEPGSGIGGQAVGRVPSRGVFRRSLIKNLGSLLGIAAMMLCPMIAVAQTSGTKTNEPSGPPPGTELFPRDCGETVVSLGHYWDGVDDNNNLHVMVSTFPVLNDVGVMAEAGFPPAVNFVDMNGDDLKDIVVCDTYGFLWIFFNSGEQGKPVFTTGTLVPTFLGWASKIHVADWDGDGDRDIVVGAFYGDFVVLYNTGGVKHPVFSRRMGIPRYVSPYYSVDDPAERLLQVRLGKAPMVLGVYMSPWVADWNKDGKPDLIFGEGTYSANSIRIALNQGSRGRPTFVEDRVFFLAYGAGFEQLTPSVVDYNGDGIPDLMSGTRTGHIRLYKGTTNIVERADIVHTLKGTKAPAVLEFDKFLTIEGKEVFDTMTNPFPCDWNEDGLFDILMGSTKGIFYVALNQGTKTEPSFPKVQTVKGTNTDKDLLAPAGWWNGIGHATALSGWHFDGRVDYIGDICNAVVLLTAEKELALKPGLPPVTPVEGQYFPYFRYEKNYPGWTLSPKSGTISVIGGRVIGPSITLTMEIGKRYEFYFSSILLGGSAQWRLVGYEYFEGTEEVPPRHERREVSGPISPSAGWQKRALTFTCPGTQKGHKIGFALGFLLPEGDCKFCVDGFSLKEIAREQR